MYLSRTQQKQKENILKTSKKLILEKGFIETSVTDICNEANIGRKTFYNYYKNKEQLAMDIAFNLGVDEKVYEFEIKDEQTGFELLHDYLHQLYDQVLSNHVYLVLMNEFDSIFSGHSYFLGVSNIEELKEHILYKIVEKGVNDGSILSYGLATHQILLTLFVPLFSGFQKYASRHEVFSNEFDTSYEDMKKAIIFVLNGINAHPNK